jgi:hypothetical protein
LAIGDIAAALLAAACFTRAPAFGSNAFGDIARHSFASLALPGGPW